MPSMSRVDQIYKDWKKLSPGNKLKVSDGQRTGIVSAVGNDCVFVKWDPFDSYVDTISEKINPDDINVIGTLYPIKRNKKRDDFFTF